MPAKALIAEQRPTHYYVQVHIDTTKVLEDGVTPDPAWVREYRFGLDLSAGQNLAQYRAAILAQIKALVVEELVRLQAGVTVAALQGQTW